MKHVCAVIAFLIVLPSVVVRAAPPYRPIDLGTLGGTFSGAEAVSDTGVVVGYSQVATSDDLHAFVWTSGTGMMDIGVLSPCCSPLFVSQNGLWVAGNTLVPGDDAPHAFVWTLEDGMVDISDGRPFSWVRGVNNNGMVIGGWAMPNDPVAQAFVWTPSTGMIDLGLDLAPVALNNRGQVVVNRSPGTDWEHAFLWTRARGLIDIDPANKWNLTQANDVNEDGIVVGGATKCGATSCFTHAFRWTRAGGLVDVDRGRSGFNTVALGITNEGLVAGRLSFGNRASHVFARRPSGDLIDTGALGGAGTEFSAVSRGTIVGSSQITNGRGHAFAWTVREGMIDLDSLGGGGSATAINRGGLVVGQSCTDPATTPWACRAFAWVRDR